MYQYMGPAVYYPNQNIRRMLCLARLEKDDTFFDLGSGYGQNLIIALSEFGASRVVGFETDKQRLFISKERLKKVCPPDVGEIFNKHFIDGLTKKRLKHATVIYCGVEDLDIELLQKIERAWSGESPGRRFVYHHKNVPPELMPDDVAFPFYVSRTQLIDGKASFRHPKSEREWLEKVVTQPEDVIKGSKRTLFQLWKEFANNYDVEELKDSVEGVKDRLKKAVKKYANL